MNSLKLPNSSHFFHVSSYHFPLASIHVPMLSLIFVNPLLLPYFLRSKSTSTMLQSTITNLQYDLYPFLSSQERLLWCHSICILQLSNSLWSTNPWYLSQPILCIILFQCLYTFVVTSKVMLFLMCPPHYHPMNVLKSTCILNTWYTLGIVNVNLFLHPLWIHHLEVISQWSSHTYHLSLTPKHQDSLCMLMWSLVFSYLV